MLEHSVSSDMIAIKKQAHNFITWQKKQKKNPKTQLNI